LVQELVVAASSSVAIAVVSVHILVVACAEVEAVLN
jgi:hypothetical protein